ncbi:phosphocarrier protein [Hydrogenispora ethanolica]|uniref:Phosphocarrier protein HPr n=1 Tax=Hydrogenispora ethanolica TaxID=1082276 RepID=A0A4R1SB82_HYDET|nr:HPr family phosphocarrier protein [Hydrogenispora ethanolica]TCL76514.1 phosphocarrier protein [Hydrogenispora ethanolica]
MVQVQVELKNESGLHARPASLFVKKAAQYQSEIQVLKAGKPFNGKSLLSVLAMGAYCGDQITIQAKGSDEGEAVADLQRFIENEL